MSNDEATPAIMPVTPETMGKPLGKIPVELSTRFLEHFSEQLYSSPQKAFEELISNGWDAGASCVDVRISTNLEDPNATMSVLDNGASMDAVGLRQLWHIAFSPKEAAPTQYGRAVIGKFGIGKLATYVLATRLTYICKASDGIIRRVTMDYGDIDRQAADSQDRLISDIRLDLYEVSEEELAGALSSVYDGAKILELINLGVPAPAHASADDEFGAAKSALARPTEGTWTLVIMSGLKPAGRELRIGVLRRMLRAALPIGSEMAIVVNDDLLTPSKIDAPLIAEWILGPELPFDYIEVDDSDIPISDEDHANDAANAPNEVDKQKAASTRIELSFGTDPLPYVEVPGIGKVTGTARLFVQRISGTKSDERGASNGFHVNVLGREVNQADPSFGEDNLSHAAWARFRLAVRADGLNEFLTTDREKFRERRELKVFRAFLRKTFNLARTTYDADNNAEMPHGGDILVQSLGVVSLNPLRNVVSEALESEAPISGLFDETGISDRSAMRRSWRDNTAENIKSALGNVKYERLSEGDSFVKFRIADNTIIVNKDHPFVVEHSRTKAEKELLRTIAMVNLLSDMYALDIGVHSKLLDGIRQYRDKLMRFQAMKRRESGTYIAKLLLQMQHDSSNNKRLEAALSDALRYLGFDVKDLAKPGEPEGIAKAYPTPTRATPSVANPNPPLYSFSFDAKSSKNDVAETGNIKLDAVVEHRKRYNADYALVVAPGFSEGALAVRCEQQQVTPMTAHDLGKLLEFTVEFGAIPVTKLREVFQLHNPIAVSQWVEGLPGTLKEQRQLTIDIFLTALKRLKGKVPDSLPAAMISFECREHLHAYSVSDDDVIAVASGLSILVPDLVGIDGDKIVVNASADRVAAAVSSQLERLHDDSVEVGEGGE
jgi:Histidine kinase-, DNA gyrase B-, and HSP90-like ATPase